MLKLEIATHIKKCSLMGILHHFSNVALSTYEPNTAYTLYTPLSHFYGNVNMEPDGEKSKNT
jgi:hypothetical protein